MTGRYVYIEPSDFDRLIAALTARTDERIARAVVVKEDDPLFYFGPIELLACTGGEAFKLLTTAPAGEVLPFEFGSWRLVMVPRYRFIELYVDGYRTVTVYDTLKGAGQ